MRQQLVQKQALERKLSQSLIQSIQLLQFNSSELHEYINEIVEENPLIEEVVYDSETYSGSRRVSKGISIEEVNASEKSFYDRMREQLALMDIPEHLLSVVEFGIYSLDESGYLDISLEEWAEGSGVPLSVVEEALHLLQQLEPAGIGARNLSECLYLQLRNMPGYQDYMKDLLAHHLDWIADQDIEAIMAEYDLETAEVTELFEMIKQCNPKPGTQLDRSDAEYIIPEAKIYKDENRWKITFHHWNMPKLIINPQYETINDKQAKKFIQEKRHQLNWLEDAIKYRQSTIERVINKLVEKQIDFFEQGVLHLKSMTLSDIANELKLHPSTISRAIHHKYVETPHGILPIKFFFQSGVPDGNGKKAAIAIKYLIRQLIENEDKRKPLSDERIRKILREEHSLQIARRTIMKYRQEMNIPSSYERRKTDR